MERDLEEQFQVRLKQKNQLSVTTIHTGQKNSKREVAIMITVMIVAIVATTETLLTFAGKKF